MLYKLLPAACLLASVSAFSFVPHLHRTPARASEASAICVLREHAPPIPARQGITLTLRGGRPTTPRMALDESQQRFTAERLAQMSKGEIQHIFEDVDQVLLLAISPCACCRVSVHVGHVKQ